MAFCHYLAGNVYFVTQGFEYFCIYGAFSHYVYVGYFVFLSYAVGAVFALQAYFKVVTVTVVDYGFSLGKS